MLKISIPTPCHQDWDAMTPNTQGKYCNSCAKTVVDFTNMNDEEVKYFFINKKDERVCGRFRNTQLQRITIELPQNIFYIQMPFWKRFLVASLLVFSATLFSCDTTVKGVVVDKSRNATKEYTIKEYSIGKGFPPNTELPPPPPECTTVGFSIPRIVEDTIYSSPIVQGDTSIITDSPLTELPNTTIPEKKGKIKTQTSDTIKIKNPPKADSIDCNTQIYY